MSNIPKIALLMLLLSKFSLSFAVAKDSPPAPIPVTGESSVVGSTSGAAWPEKRFVAGRGATESCITDKLTGLMWSKDGNLFGEKNWKDALSVVSSMNNDKGATTYKLCGYTDWRLPTITELKSLVNYGKEIPSEWLNDPVQGFNKVLANNYWSSTSYGADSTQAWIVGFNNGMLSIYGKSSSYSRPYVWPVRGGK
ncbi:MAG: DUF1566 domain-containing protein [Burkholderiales bacterium]|nr:DUF1566 domain-containing protein [Burkholderiales bacterium]